MSRGLSDLAISLRRYTIVTGLCYVKMNINMRYNMKKLTNFHRLDQNCSNENFCLNIDFINDFEILK